MEVFRVTLLAAKIFDKKWQQKMKKEKIKNFYPPEEDEEQYHQERRNKYFQSLFEANPWDDPNPEFSTLHFTKCYFRIFKDFY
jgi:hypothetical protein